MQMDQRGKTAFFTGHRHIPAEAYPKMQKHLEEELRRLIQQGVRYFGAGGALGFDTMAAQAVLKLRLSFPHIRLILVLPCRDQAKKWSAPDIRTYRQILGGADKAVYVSEHYYDGCMQKRNRHMADHSAVCLCYLTKASGGTAYTVDYARAQGLSVINIAKGSICE